MGFVPVIQFFLECLRYSGFEIVNDGRREVYYRMTKVFYKVPSAVLFGVEN